MNRIIKLAGFLATAGVFVHPEISQALPPGTQTAPTVVSDSYEPESVWITQHLGRRAGNWAFMSHDVDRDGSDEYIVSTGTYELVVTNPETNGHSCYLVTGTNIPRQAFLHDHTGNGQEELVIVGVPTEVFDLNTCSKIDTIQWPLDTLLITSIAVGDLDADGHPDVVAADGDDLYAWELGTEDYQTRITGFGDSSLYLHDVDAVPGDDIILHGNSDLDVTRVLSGDTFRQIGQLNGALDQFAFAALPNGSNDLLVTLQFDYSQPEQVQTRVRAYDVVLNEEVYNAPTNIDVISAYPFAFTPDGTIGSSIALVGQSRTTRSTTQVFIHNLQTQQTELLFEFQGYARNLVTRSTQHGPLAAVVTQEADNGRAARYPRLLSKIHSINLETGALSEYPTQSIQIIPFHIAKTPQTPYRFHAVSRQAFLSDAESVLHTFPIKHRSVPLSEQLLAYVPTFSFRNRSTNHGDLDGDGINDFCFILWNDMTCLAGADGELLGELNAYYALDIVETFFVDTDQETGSELLIVYDDAVERRTTIESAPSWEIRSFEDRHGIEIESAAILGERVFVSGRSSRASETSYKTLGIDIRTGAVVVERDIAFTWALEQFSGQLVGATRDLGTFIINPSTLGIEQALELPIADEYSPRLIAAHEQANIGLISERRPGDFRGWPVVGTNNPPYMTSLIGLNEDNSPRVLKRFLFPFNQTVVSGPNQTLVVTGEYGTKFVYGTPLFSDAFEQ